MRQVIRAVAIEKIGKPKVLKYVKRPMPPLAADEALVKVHAASVNPADLSYRSGHLIIRKPMPHILGSDLAGEIAQIGDDVTGWQPGDRVAAAFDELGSERDGSYAEYCAVPAEQLVKLPPGLDFQTAAAAGTSFMQAWHALVDQGNIKKSEPVVIQAAADSFGAAAVQIASGQGARVIAIGRSEQAAALRGIGADVVLDDAGDDLVRQVRVATDERGAALVLHKAASDKLQQSIDMLGCQGRLVIVEVGRRRKACLDIMSLYLKNLSILGPGARPAAQNYEPILRGLAQGDYHPVVDSALPLSQARQAHEKLERRAGFGKILLVPDAILEAAKKPSNWIPIE